MIQTSPESPKLPSRILGVTHLLRLKSSEGVALCQATLTQITLYQPIHPALCSVSLFQHSGNHLMSHIRPDQKGILQGNFLAESTSRTAHPTAVPGLVRAQIQGYTVKGNRAGQHKLRLPWAHILKCYSVP